MGEESLRIFIPHLVLGTLAGCGIWIGEILHHTSPGPTASWRDSRLTMYGVVSLAVVERIMRQLRRRQNEIPVSSRRLGELLPFGDLDGKWNEGRRIPPATAA